MREFKPQPPIVLEEGGRFLAEGELIAVPLRTMPGGLMEFVLVRPGVRQSGLGVAFSSSARSPSPLPFSKKEISNVFQVNARDLEVLPTHRFSKPQVPTVFALEAAAIARASRDSKG